MKGKGSLRDFMQVKPPSINLSDGSEIVHKLIEMNGGNKKA